MERNMV